MAENTIDRESGLEIRRTDNSLKEGDLNAVQTPQLLELDANGLPVGWEAPDGDR